MPDGRIKHVLEVGRTTYEGAQPVLSYGSVQDITDRVHAAESLRRSEERLRHATEVARVGIFDHDHRTGEIYWSQRQREICGYDADAPVTFGDLTRLVHPDDHPTVDAALQRAHDPAGDGSSVPMARCAR
jgi:PAS domain-containing protein